MTFGSGRTRTSIETATSAELKLRDLSQGCWYCSPDHMKSNNQHSSDDYEGDLRNDRLSAKPLSSGG